MALRAGCRSARRCVPASSDVARRPAPITIAKRSTAPSPGQEISWTGESSHQRLFVAAAELVRLASATNGLLLTIDDVHDADDASLRLAALHRPFDARSAGLHRAHAPPGSDHRHAGGDAPEPDRPPWSGRARARPARRRRHRGAGPSPRRRTHAASWSNGSRRSAGAFRSRSTSSPAGRPTSRNGCRRSTPT